MQRGTLAVCIREIQKTLAQSSKRLIEDKIAALRVGPRRGKTDEGVPAAGLNHEPKSPNLHSKQT